MICNPRLEKNFDLVARREAHLEMFQRLSNFFYFLTNFVPSCSPSFQNVHNSEAYRAPLFPCLERDGGQALLP